MCGWSLSGVEGDVLSHGVVLDPASIVGCLVLPSLFELVSHGPQEVSINVVVEDPHHALSEGHHIIIAEEGGVLGALSVLDGGQSVGSVWSEHSSGSVEVSSSGLIKVSVWAVNPLAVEGVWGVVVIESSQPGGADISGKGPLSNPDGVLEVGHVGHKASISIAVASNVLVGSPPGEILMGVHDHILNIIVLEEIVPGVWIGSEGVVEDELQSWLLLSHHVSDISVEGLEVVNIGAPPWLVDWLNGVECWVVTPSVEESLDGVNSPVVVVLVALNEGASIIWVDSSLPSSPGVFPMTEVIFGDPLGDGGLSGVIESVLRIFHGVDVEENLDIVLLGHIHEPVDLLGGSSGAANIWSILLEGPVTDWETGDLDLSLSHTGNDILGDPSVPMSSENSVTLLGSESLAEGVLGHTNLSFSLSKESVEEGWGDPWLEDLPSSNVGSNSGSLGRDKSGECDSGESFHLIQKLL